MRDDDGDDADDDMSIADGSTPKRGGNKERPPPREKLRRVCKGKSKADVKVKTEPPDVKVKTEPKVGEKRNRGGQNGVARGPYKKANVGVVLKGSDAPTVNLVSPDKGTRRPRHAFARILAACSSIEM